MLTTLWVTGLVQIGEVLARAGGGSGGGRSGGGGGGGGGFSGGGSGGGFTSGGSSSGSGAIALGSFATLIVFGGFGFIVLMIVLSLIRKRGAMSGGTMATSQAGLATDYDNLPHTGDLIGGDASRTTDAELKAGLAAIVARDPQFNEPDFISDVNRAFFVIQQAWTERKPELSRQVMHDGIWQQHKFQIDQYLSANKQNVLENLAVQNTRLVAAHTDAAFDTVVVRFFASCADYDIDLSDDDRKVVRGDRAIHDWSEDWIFQRSSKATTKPNAGTMAQKCPNCGAPLDLDLAGVCKYCKAPVMSGEFDWVLTRIEQLPSYEWAQATLPT